MIDEDFDAMIERILEQHRELMENLKKLEDSEKKRCLACFFAPCRCRQGLERKRHL